VASLPRQAQFVGIGDIWVCGAYKRFASEPMFQGGTLHINGAIAGGLLRRYRVRKTCAACTVLVS
jgi:hypothetical protein